MRDKSVELEMDPLTRGESMKMRRAKKRKEGEAIGEGLRGIFGKILLPFLIALLLSTITVPLTLAEGNSANDRVDVTKIYGAFSDSLIDLGSGSGIVYSVAVGDMDNDGDLDVIAGNYDSHIYEFRNDGGTWTKIDIGSGKNEMYGVAIADLDNDGDLDVVTGCSNGYIYVFRNDKGTWTKIDIGSGGFEMYDVAIADLDNDGDLDIIGANGDSYLYQFRNDNGTWNKTDIGHGEHYMLSVAVGDLDNDGDLDVTGGNNDGYIYEFEKDNGMWSKIKIGYAEDRIGNIKIKDMDRDGDLDVIGSNRNAHAYEFRNDEGKWTWIDMGYDKQYTGSIAVADIDDDGDLDMIGSYLDNHVYIFINTGRLSAKGNFVAAEYSGEEDGDGDGIPDYLEGWPREGAIYACSPYLKDSDGDGIDDGEEVDVGMNPCSTDTDGDFMSDYYELKTAWDPDSADPFDCCPYVPDLPRVSLDVDAKRLDMDITVTRGASKSHEYMEYEGRTESGSTTTSFSAGVSNEFSTEVKAGTEAGIKGKGLIPEYYAKVYAYTLFEAKTAFSASAAYSQTTGFSVSKSHQHSDTFEIWQEQSVDYSQAKLKGTLNLFNDWGRVIKVGRVWINVFIDGEVYETGAIPLDITIGENEEFNIVVSVDINQHAIEAIEAGKQAIFRVEKAEIEVVSPETAESRTLEIITSNAWDTCGFVEVDFNNGNIVRKMIYTGPDKRGLMATDALHKLGVDIRTSKGKIISVGGIRNMPGLGRWTAVIYQNIENPLSVPEELSELQMHKKYYVSVLYLQDTDNDWLVDRIERYAGTDPNDPDSDNDLLDDYTEVYILNSDPNRMDTDSGGVFDCIEFREGTDLNNPGDDPFYIPTWLSKNKIGAEDAANLIIRLSTDVDGDHKITGNGQLKWVGVDDRAWTGVKYGSAGIVMFMSRLARITGNETYLEVAKEAANWLTNVEDDYVLNELEPIMPEMDKITGFGELEWLNYEGGTPDLSYANGTAGIMSALIDLYYASGDEKYMLAVVEGSTRLLDNRMADVLDFGEEGYNGSQKLAWDTDGDGNGDIGYMNGTAGIADSLLKTWTVTYQTDWKNIYYILAAMEAGNWLISNETSDVTYSSGKAGIIPALLRIYTVSGEDKFLEKAQEYADITEGYNDTDIWHGEAGILNGMIELYKHTASVDSYNSAVASGNHLCNLSWDLVKDVDGDGEINGNGTLTWTSAITGKNETSYYDGVAGITSELMELYFITNDVSYINAALEGSNWLLDAKKILQKLDFWKYPTRNDVTSIALGDVNGNGLSDIIVGMQDRLLVVSDDGTYMWKYTTNQPVHAIASGDFDGDGVDEVAFGIYNDTHFVIHVLDDNSATLWHREYEKYSGNEEFILLAANVNGDEREDIIAVMDSSLVHEGEQLICAIAGGSSPLWNYTTDKFVGTESIVKDAAVGDFNKDSLDDVAWVGTGGMVYTIATNSSSTVGELLWKKEVPAWGRLDSVVVRDFDTGHNGIDDVVVGCKAGIFALNGFRGYDLWNYSVVGNYESADLAVCDINGDSFDDVALKVSKNTSAKVFAVTTPTTGNIGELIWSVYANYSSLGIAAADINGDRYGDVVTPIYNWTSEKPYKILVLNGTDGSMSWEYNTEEYIHKIATGNIYGDGNPDVIAATNRWVHAISETKILAWPEYEDSKNYYPDMYSGEAGVGHGLLLTAANAPSIRPLGFVGSASASPNETCNISIMFFNGALFATKEVEVELREDRDWIINDGEVEQPLKVIQSMNALQQREIVWTVKTPSKGGIYPFNISIVSTQQGATVSRESVFSLDFTVEGFVLTDLKVKENRTYMNAGENTTVDARIVYVSNHKGVENGTICINGSDRMVYLTTNETGWANITMAEAEPIERFCDVYGLRSRELGFLPSTHQNTTITWTGLKILPLNVSAEQVEVGESVYITAEVVYGHNDSAAIGANVSCNGQYNTTDSEGKAMFTVSKNVTGTFEYTITAISDVSGEITACVQNQTALITYIDQKKPAISIVSPSQYAPVYGIVTLQINATDEETGIERVELYIDNVFQCNITTISDVGYHEYKLITTNYNTGWHLISIKAYDGAGNSMATDLELNFVDGSFDTTKPVIASVVHEPENPDEKDIVTVEAKVTDDNVVSLVKLRYTVNEGVEQTATMIDPDGDTIYSACIGPFNANDSIVYSILAKDTCSNINISASYNFSVLHNTDCGDVNYDDVVDMSDVIDLLYYVGYPGQYTIRSEWAADVNCDEAIDMSDVIDLLYHVGYPGQYELKCCLKE